MSRDRDPRLIATHTSLSGLKGSGPLTNFAAIGRTETHDGASQVDPFRSFSFYEAVIAANVGFAESQNSGVEARQPLAHS